MVPNLFDVEVDVDVSDRFRPFSFPVFYVGEMKTYTLFLVATSGSESRRFRAERLKAQSERVSTMMYYRPAQNRLLASLADPYPVFTPSPEAVVEIETLAALHQVDFPERFGLLAGTTFYENM